MAGSGLVAAVRILTVVPLPGPEPQRRAAAVPWFGVVGLGIGGVLYGCARWVYPLLPQSLPFTGLCMTAGYYALTGMLHLDGLADTADAFGTRHTRERTLEILKDPHIGVFGTASLVLVLLWRVLLFETLCARGAGVWCVYMVVLSRIGQGLLLALLPYARGASGKAHGLKGTRGTVVLLIGELSVVAGCMNVFHGGALTAVACVAAVVAAALPVYAAVRRLGGITGDILGAATELFECVLLAVVVFGS